IGYGAGRRERLLENAGALERVGAVLRLRRPACGHEDERGDNDRARKHRCRRPASSVAKNGWIAAQPLRCPYQVPAQAPPCANPRKVPLPVLPLSRPDPAALRSPLTTRT